MIIILYLILVKANDDDKQIAPKKTNKNLVRQQSYKMNRSNIFKSSSKNIKKVNNFTRK